MVLYASGTALNDVFDFEVDRAERPGRPLPSGRVSPDAPPGSAGRTGLGARPVAGAASGSIPAAVVAVVLARLHPGYDAGLKHTSLGPAFMGACRGLNLLLGMTHAPALGGPIAWLAAAAAYGLFVAGITVSAVGDPARASRRGLVAGLTLQDLALLGLAAVRLGPSAIPRPARRTGR